MNRYIVDVTHEKSYRMPVWADNEEEALARAKIEAPEKIVREFARLTRTQYRVDSVFRTGEIDEENEE